MLEPLFTEHHYHLVRCGVVESLIPGLDELKKQASQLQTGEGLGTFAADATATVVNRLWQKNHVVTEIYKSSALTQNDKFSDTNVDLTKLGTLVIYNPVWCGAAAGAMSTVLGLAGKYTQNSCYHSAMFPLYFLQFGLPASPMNPRPPALVSQIDSALRACPTPSASCSDDQLREWVDRQNLSNVAGQQRWMQATGIDTFNISDDSFTLQPALSGQSEIVEVDAGQRYGAINSQDKEGFSIELGSTKVEFPFARWIAITVVALCTIAMFAGFACMCVQMSNRKAEEEYESGVSSGADEGNVVHRLGRMAPSNQSFPSGSDVDSTTPLTGP